LKPRHTKTKRTAKDGGLNSDKNFRFLDDRVRHLRRLRDRGRRGRLQGGGEGGGEEL